jgi:hypothetical protein
MLAIAVGIASHPVFGQVSAPISRAFMSGGIYALQSDSQTAPQPTPPSSPDAPAPQNPAPFDRSSLSGYNTREKFIYDTKNVFGPVPLILNAIGAGIGQSLNSPSQWGQGAEGYADRFASSFGTNMAHQYIGFGLESVLHEDPRYMLSKDHSAKGRLRAFCASHSPRVRTPAGIRSPMRVSEARSARDFCPTRGSLAGPEESATDSSAARKFWRSISDRILLRNSFRLSGVSRFVDGVS